MLNPRIYERLGAVSEKTLLRPEALSQPRADRPLLLRLLRHHCSLRGPAAWRAPRTDVRAGALPAVFRRRRFGWVHYFPAPTLSAEEAADPTLAMYSVCWARSGASARAVSDVEWLVLQARGKACSDLREHRRAAVEAGAKRARAVALILDGLHSAAPAMGQVELMLGMVQMLCRMNAAPHLLVISTEAASPSPLLASAPSRASQGWVTGFARGLVAERVKLHCADVPARLLPRSLALLSSDALGGLPDSETLWDGENRHTLRIRPMSSRTAGRRRRRPQACPRHRRARRAGPHLARLLAPG